MKLRILDLGRLTLPPGYIYPVDDLDPASVPDRIQVPVSSYLIEHRQGNVLFDLGCHPEAMGPEGRWSEALQTTCPHSGGEECTLPSRLVEQGLLADDIDYAVLSHLHNDHAGCVEFFRNTRLIVHRDEHDAAFGLPGNTLGISYVGPDIAAWRGLNLDWQFVERDDAELQLLDGLRIINCGRGHAHGMLALMVELKDYGPVLLASDAVLCGRNFGPPARLPAGVLDPQGAMDTQRMLLEIAEKEGAEVWFGHDLEQFSALISKRDFYS